MKKVQYIAIFVIFFLYGCAFPPALHPKYDWGNYSHALYKHKKSHTDASYQEYKKSLADIIEKTKTSGNPVPPGIYCEYGFILAQEGKLEEAKIYFEFEKKTYPESRIFVDKLITELDKKGDSI